MVKIVPGETMASEEHRFPVRMNTPEAAYVQAFGLAPDDYVRLTNRERTVLVCIWPSGKRTVATRQTSAHTWGPPTALFPADGGS